MGWRYRRSVKVFGGVRLNLSRSGVGISAGGRGYRVSVGPRGVRTTIGVPGTGLSYVHEESWKQRSRATEIYSEDQDSNEDWELRKPSLFASADEKNLYRGINAYINGDDSEAGTYLLRLAEKDDCARFYVYMMLAENEPERALRLLEEIVLSDSPFPTDLMERLAIPELYLPLDLGSPVELEVTMDKAGLIVLLADSYRLLGNREVAIDLIQQYAKDYPTKFMLLLLCQLYADVGDLERVQLYASDKPVFDEATFCIKLLHAWALGQTKNYYSVVHILSQALDADVDVSPILRLEARYWRATSRTLLGHHKRAQQEFEELFADAPDFRNVREFVQL